MAIEKNSKCAPEAPEAHEGQIKRDIIVDKGHVRRALRVTEVVYREPLFNQGKDNGVVLMTAVLLVERLAASLECDPLVVLENMARCFAFKRRYLQSLKGCN